MCASVIGTWSFSLLALNEIASCLKNGGDIIDAMEKGINVVEEDPDTGKDVVGRGGFPNEKGILECDAAVMDGNGCRFGSVAAIPGVSIPFSVARLVMEKSPYSILVGEGAQMFAKEHGITIWKNELLQTQDSVNAYENFLKTKKKSSDANSGHDTIGVLVKDPQGNIIAGTSTSGKPFKSCGRVGDSPLPGAGLYADNEITQGKNRTKAGAAAATGDGDNILRFCPCFQVVQLMKHSVHPKEACRRVIADIWRRVGKHGMFRMALIAMNTEGKIGMAGTYPESPNHFGPIKYPGFAYSLWNSEYKGSPEVLCEPALVWEDVENLNSLTLTGKV